MTLGDRIRAFFNVQKVDSGGGEKISPTGYEASGMDFDSDSQAKKREFLKEMKGWVGSAVFAIADSVAMIEIKLFKKTKEGVEEIVDHPILDLLFRVNNFTTYFDHFWLTQSYLELTGEAPWFLDKKGSEIENIFFLRPDKIKPLAGKSNLIEGYEYEIKPGQTVKLNIDEVLFLKYPNPVQPFRGIGTLKMAALTVDIDNNSEKWNNEFYKNSARPDSIMVVKTESMDQEQKDRLKKSLKELYQGTKNAHKNMLLFGDIEFSKAGFNQKDMDFDNQQKFSRDKILGIFRVPKAIVSQTEGVNFASAKVAEYIFLKFTIKPKMERMIQQLNEFLLPMFAGTEEMFLDMKNPVPADDEKDVVKYNSALTHGWMTINEVREEQGLEPLEGGDVAFVPMGRMEIGDEADKNDRPEGDKPKPEEEKPKPDGEPVEEPEEGKRYRMLKGKRPRAMKYGREAGMRARSKVHFKVVKARQTIKDAIKEELRKGLNRAIRKDKPKMSQIVKKIHKKSEPELQRVLSEQEVVNYWEIKNQIFQTFRKRVEKDLQKVFAVQRKSTLLKLSKAKIEKGTDEFFEQIKLNQDKEVARTLDLTFGTFASLFEEAGNETFQMMQFDAEMNIDRDVVRNIIRDNGRIFAKGVTEVTNKFIREQMIDGLGKGESIPDLKKRIVNVFDSANDMRAQRIARTETLRYNTLSSEQAFKDSGVVEGKMWITDPEPCQYCATLAGKTAPLGQNFVNKGDVILDRAFDYDDLPSPPLHPNCQCDLIPVFKPVQVNLKKVNLDLDSLYKKTNSAKSQIDGIGGKILSGTKGLGAAKGGILSKRNVKARQASLESAVDNYKGDVSKLTDVVSNVVVVRSESDFTKVAGRVLTNHTKSVVDYKKISSNSDSFGFSGISVKLTTKENVIGEMQINTAWMIYAKETKDSAITILGQDLYDKISDRVRLIGGKGNEFYEIGRSTKDAVLKAKMEKDSIEYYNLIRKRIGDKI